MPGAGDQLSYRLPARSHHRRDLGEGAAGRSQVERLLLFCCQSVQFRILRPLQGQGFRRALTGSSGRLFHVVFPRELKRSDRQFYHDAVSGNHRIDILVPARFAISLMPTEC